MYEKIHNFRPLTQAADPNARGFGETSATAIWKSLPERLSDLSIPHPPMAAGGGFGLIRLKDILDANIKASQSKLKSAALNALK
jgi:hypothetical protein